MNDTFVGAVCNLVGIIVWNRTRAGSEDADHYIDATDHYLNVLLSEIHTDPELAQLRPWADAIDEADAIDDASEAVQL